MILTRFPHKIQYCDVSPSYEDGNGDYHKGEETYPEYIECRCTPSGKANEMVFEDGIVKTYSYTVSLHQDCREFKLGEKVKVTLLNGVERNYTVLGFQRYETHSKLWV